jgi:transcriptional regulator with XRE-family HTH domain
MNSSNLASVGRLVKSIRKSRSMKLNDLAVASSISIGMLSKIENFRTVPSLEVLIKISNGLQVDLGELVKEVKIHKTQLPYRVIKDADYILEEREDSPDFKYLSIASDDVHCKSFKVMKVILPPGTSRDYVSSDARQLVYVMKGSIYYSFTEDVEVACGASIFFDATQPHALKNTGTEPAELLVTYLIN